MTDVSGRFGHNGGQAVNYVVHIFNMNNKTAAQ